MVSLEQEGIGGGTAEASAISENLRRQYVNWCFTFNYGGSGQATTQEVELWIEALTNRCWFGVYGREQATTGQLHLQGYIQLYTRARITELKKIGGGSIGRRVHWEPAKATAEENWAYCTKEGDFETINPHNPPRDSRAGLTVANDKWADTLQCCKENRMEDCDPMMLIRYVKNLEHLQSLFQSQPQEISYLTKMQWVWGPTGTGKSKGVRDNIREWGKPFYCKMQNKWWDNYKNEPVVLIDDLGIEMGKALTTHIKQWFDIYPFQAEIKGRAVLLRPELFIVTANCHPYDIWGSDLTNSYDPIMRRIEVHYWGNGEPAPERGPQASVWSFNDPFN